MEKVFDFLLKELGLKPREYIVVGVSGGPDSMVLLRIFEEIRKENDIYIVCAHINHNVRAESRKEKSAVQKHCDNNQIYFESTTLEDYGDDNFHNEARTRRYEFFEKIVKKYGAKYLFTGHHADDLIETILMRISRGSTLKGYAGFKKEVDMVDYKIVRPFIDITKKEILEYASKNRIKYYEDNSNKKSKYTRNRYRKHILPFLKKEDPNIHEKYLKLSKILLDSDDYLENETSRVIKEVYSQGILNIEMYLKQKKVIQNKIINNILENIYQDDLMLITDIHTNLIDKLIRSTKSNSNVHLPNNILVVKSYNNIFFTVEKSSSSDYEIELSNYINLSNGMNLEVIKSSEATNNFVCRLNTKELKLPLFVRNRRLGDKMEVKGMLGRKKVKDIFIDSKTSIEDREQWPLLLDASNKILWLPGLKKSKYDKDKNEEYDIIIKYY